MHCIHCPEDIDPRDLTQIVAFETIGRISLAHSIEWAHLECEARATHTPVSEIVALRDGDTYLRIPQMQNALEALNEAAYERQQAAGGFLDTERMLASMELKR